MTTKSAEKTRTCDAQRDGLRITFENPFDTGATFEEILSAYRSGARKAWACEAAGVYQVGNKVSCTGHVCILLNEAAHSDDWEGNQVAVTVLSA